MGAWDGYYSLAGTEIANEERFRSYVENVAPWLPLRRRSLEQYEGLHTALGDPEYTTPVDDLAPWVDLNDPVSQDFLGFSIIDIEGLESSTRVAGVTESLGRGGSVGTSRDASREIRVTGMLVGLTPESVQRGFAWLRNALWARGNTRPLVPQMPGVADLRFFAQRPDVPDTVVNRVLNPSATLLGESLVGTNGTAYAFRALDEADAWSYKITARVAGDAEAQLVPAQRARAVPGQQWVARATLWRAAAVSGTRVTKLLLRFRDQYGNILLTVGANDTSVPSGVLYRWKGMRFESTSQMLTPAGMVENFIANPSAEGTTLGLAPVSGGPQRVALANTTAISGKKAYLITTGGTGDQSVQSRTAAAAEAGQQWWGRARGKLQTAAGARHFRADLAFLNAAGREISRVAGAVVDRVPSGTFHRWRGRVGRSSSVEYIGNTQRINYTTNPAFTVDTGTVSGRNATLAREKTTALGEGSTYAVRVTPSNTNDVVTGLTVGLNAPIGSTIYVTFLIQSIGGGISMRLTGTGFTAASGNAADLTFSAATTAARVTIPIKITAEPSGQILRLARVSSDNMRAFRVTRIGTIDGPGAYFDGDSANTGPAFDSSVFDLSVGGIAPDDARSARLLITSLGTGPTDATDQFLLDQVMLTQQDVDEGATPTLPAFFDGDFASTYQNIPATSITSTTSAKTDAVVTATAPEGAVTAELAVQRAGTGGTPAVGDIIYADDLLLTDYDGVDAPAFTPYTRKTLLAETERWMQEVHPIAGPTVIQDVDLDCRGSITKVEFTLVAENPSWLRDNGDVIPLPLPNAVSGTTGAGAFAKIEDRGGIVKNFMPQFSRSSPIIPTGWLVENSNGNVEAKGIQPDPTLPYVLYVRVGPAGTNWQATVSAISALGERGGYEGAVASIWVGVSAANKPTTIKLTTYNGHQSVAAYTKTVTPPVSSDGNVFSDAYRVDIPLPNAGAGVDGFRFTVTGSTDQVITYIANPQVTLSSTAFPMINGTLPDDGAFTYDFDAAGFSRRTPVKNVRSHTIFANLTLPPAPITGLSGYDEIGLTTYRTYVPIPPEIVPSSASAVPIFRADFDAYITRWIRVRFYPNPHNALPEQIDTASFTHEWVIDLASGNVKQYNAAGVGYTSIVIDGVSRRTWLRAQDGTVIPADQFVATSEGSPISWPELRGIPYVVSVEYPPFKQANEPAGEGWWRTSLALMIEE